jgi:diguanylate cyclase (GGDEF)-like protein
VAERVRATILAPVEYEGKVLTVTSSIGAAVRDANVADLFELFHNADRALYAAKAAGRNTLVMFDGSQPDTVATDRSGVRSSRTAAA